ncbi:TrkH family potassium uptake protein [Tenggerimyces flavus]|uniref:TrkH family potassium uptake protein n=1 Tax=Tenggerimyces flavus TaxID=1708749 RepID=A0ABV7Y9Q4_9ACTN|nr:potassium transporter TrkG [Tenggerimyces flavus]MBM7786533.1 potassium uptake TrkH family protein [Tenggerimyces flavus]
MRRELRHPARLVPLAFLAVIVAGTVLLMLPVSATDQPASFVTALFTATSATCVTGLAVVDTQAHWSTFGHVVIMMLIQAGGFGIMTLASLLGLLVNRRLGLRSRLVAQAETHSLVLGDVRRLLLWVGMVMLTVEAIVAAILTVRFRLAYYDGLGEALWQAVFHAVSAFNNAGFSLYSANLTGFVSDGWICLPIAVAFMLGGLGFPVLYELRRGWRRPAHWSVHVKLTLLGSAVLVVTGWVAYLLLEWTNSKSLGALDVSGKVLASFFQGVSPRTAGFNSLDYAALRPETLALTDVLMFIGGGSAGTAGGIKVTTFFLLAFVILAEIRGDPEVTLFRRQLAASVQRLALTVALLGVGVVAAGTFALLLLTDHPFDAVLFESISAFATVGLSMGVTTDLNHWAQLVLVILMFVGRVGTITVATALALRERRRLYRLPEERLIVG